jgi:hypothetical protein
MAGMVTNSSFTSILANSKYAGIAGEQVDYVVDAVTRSGPWALFFTIVAFAVAYDQSMYTGTDPPWEVMPGED